MAIDKKISDLLESAAPARKRVRPVGTKTKTGRSATGSNKYKKEGEVQAKDVIKSINNAIKNIIRDKEDDMLYYVNQNDLTKAEKNDLYGAFSKYLRDNGIKHKG